MFGIDDIVGAGLKIIDKVIPDPQAKAQAQIELQKLANDGHLADLQADMNEQDNVSKRWEADLNSDSWLSKNIRPMTLIAILCGYFIFATASAFELNVKQAYVELLGQWGMLIMSAYFGGRTLEKIMAKKGSNGN
ncbi:holin [Bacteriophage sp.]|nr:holin [Bacteriophage sp.]